MSLGDDDNFDGNTLPFNDCELDTVVNLDTPTFRKSKKNNTRTKYKSKQQSNDATTNNNQTKKLYDTFFYIYFENSQKENNFLSLTPYTGPSNTLHLGKQLYLAQLTSNIATDSLVSYERFIEDYDQTILSMKPSLATMSLAVYLRFGISYILRTTDTILEQSISLKDYAAIRYRGKDIKTSFYTCKGVTSPKRLLTTITKLNYHEISSNIYSYDVQLYDIKNNKCIIHFQYDEQFQCESIYIRPGFPLNFDFIRNKTSSIFRSIDNSYSDIFDFRIQLVQAKYLSKTDPNVLKVLRGVPIDQVLFIDKSTHVLHIAPKLQKFVKYLKCTRSRNYQNFDEQIRISIGTYEEFQLNTQGQCESLMKASNTMTIELLDAKDIPPSGKKLYDIGMWFSSLCQTCVDLPSTILKNNPNKSCRWFSDIFIFRKKYSESIKQMNVNQLTTYKIQTSKQTYTNEEIIFVRNILQEENLRNILLNVNEEKSYDRKDIQKRFESIKEKLKTMAVPSANDALKKVERAYRVVCEEFVET